MTALDLTLREEVARPERRRAGRAAWLTVPVILGLIVFGGWLVIALTISLWSPYDPLATTGLPLLPPSAEHLLGTDALGRDVLARTLYGVRASLPLCFAVIAGGVAIGSLFGAAAGFFGGWVDAVLMRLTDVVLAFPAILLAMVMTAALGPGLVHAGIAMVIVWWPIYARLLRAQILSVKEQAHV
jgi:peptide/nickel transport system permease protein